jgi:hypothetical protein
VLLNRDEARFVGEAIPIRNLVIIGGLGGAFPVLYWTRKRWPRYPVRPDNLYLSFSRSTWQPVRSTSIAL